MRTMTCILIVLTMPIAALAADDVQKELQTLKGKWKAVAMEAGGQPLPKDQMPVFTVDIGADGKSTGHLPEEKFQFTITIDPKKSPKTIDNLHETGDQKGKKQYGIYKLDGDKWTVCMTMPGSAEKDRPKDFATKETTNVVFVFERVKDDKKP